MKASQRYRLARLAALLVTPARFGVYELVDATPLCVLEVS